MGDLLNGLFIMEKQTKIDDFSWKVRLKWMIYNGKSD